MRNVQKSNIIVRKIRSLIENFDSKPRKSRYIRKTFLEKEIVLSYFATPNRVEIRKKKTRPEPYLPTTKKNCLSLWRTESQVATILQPLYTFSPPPPLPPSQYTLTHVFIIFIWLRVSYYMYIVHGFVIFAQININLRKSPHVCILFYSAQSSVETDVFFFGQPLYYSIS